MTAAPKADPFGRPPHLYDLGDDPLSATRGGLFAGPRLAFQMALCLELWPRRSEARPDWAEWIAARPLSLDVRAGTLGAYPYEPTEAGSLRVPIYWVEGPGGPVPDRVPVRLPRRWRRRLRRPLTPPVRVARVLRPDGGLDVAPGPRLRSLSPAAVAFGAAALGLDPLDVALGRPVPDGWRLPSEEAGRVFLRAVATNARRFERGPASTGDALGAVVGLTLAAVLRVAPHVTTRIGGLALRTIAAPSPDPVADDLAATSAAEALRAGTSPANP